jgi:hypothetical protein
MSKQRHNYKGNSTLIGLKGWEKKYLKDSIKYGHLNNNNNNNNRRNK